MKADKLTFSALIGFILGVVVVTVFVKVKPEVLLSARLAEAKVEGYNQATNDVAAVFTKMEQELHEARKKNTPWYNLGADKTAFQFAERVLRVVRENLPKMHLVGQ